MCTIQVASKVHLQYSSEDTRYRTGNAAHNVLLSIQIQGKKNLCIFPNFSTFAVRKRVFQQSYFDCHEMQ